MDNRRPTNNKPFSPRKFQDNKEGSTYHYNKNPNNRLPPREGGDRIQNREGGDRLPPREGSDRSQPREGGDRFQNRDNRSFQPRTNTQDNRNFRDNRDSQNRNPRDNRGGQSNFRQGSGQFQPRNNPTNRFQPRGKFQPGGKTAKPWLKEDNIKIVSDKQITDGKHKGKYLQNSVSPKVQPTVRRIREAMFKILSRKIRAGRFLDLCAGSGTMGVEAISRGAIASTFIERSAKMCSFIKKNLDSLSIRDGHGTVVEIEAAPFLKQVLKRRRYWDVVYLDPPSGEGFDEIMQYLSRGAGVAVGGVLVVEHPSEVFLPEKSGVLRRWRVVLQGDRAISFFERK